MMKTNETGRLAWSAGACALTLLTLTIGTAGAEVPSTTAYFFSSHPMISGTVITVNDHQMVVNTDQGEQVTLEVDSRTMAPRDFAPGMVMRAEFRALEDCRLYAERILPIREGMSTNRQQAYANTREGGTTMAGNVSGSGDYRGYRSESQVAAYNEVRRDHLSDDLSPGRMMTATHTTADFQFSNRPLLSGLVLSVNDHRLVVETDQGQKVGLVMDSRTMLSRDVAPGTIVRAQFIPFKDGRYYAQRISRIGNSVVNREQAYAHTRDSDFAIAATPPDCGYVSTANTSTSFVEPRREVARPEPVYAQSIPAPVVEESAPVVAREEVLPQTASRQPLILLLALIALGSAGAVVALRSLRMA